MNPEELQHHVTAAARPEARRQMLRRLAACWPGGSHDRSERAALAWLRRWRPEKLGATLPVCSCPTGHCTVCN